MKRIIPLFLLILVIQASGQSVSQKLIKAVKQLESDPQMRHALVSLCVVDASTGKKVIAHNDQTGMAPASTQKLLTSAAAFELLGHDYRYTTKLGHSGTIENGVLNGHLFILGSGDPTLGSWRYSETKEEVLLGKWLQALRSKGVKRIDGKIAATSEQGEWSGAGIPDGWIWQDIGNYYGAGAYLINWRENQYDLVLRSGRNTGDAVQIVSTLPRLYDVVLHSEVRAGPKNSGDNAYIYLPPFAQHGVVRGTIPPAENAFTISGAFPDPRRQLIRTMEEIFEKNGIAITGGHMNTEPVATAGAARSGLQAAGSAAILSVHQSPPLDSINYWFLRKSVNLYGEALVKTIGVEKTGDGNLDKGLDLVREQLTKAGIDKGAIRMIDGSGLSPQNRVTTGALVKVLQFARTRPWFASFYHALPEFNGMKMKSGSIGGARAYAGYHTAKDGKQYIFSIIINNYEGSSAQAVRKMYEVLNVLK